jgi:hypothetical protein
MADKPKEYTTEQMLASIQRAIAAENKKHANDKPLSEQSLQEYRDAGRNANTKAFERMLEDDV